MPMAFEIFEVHVRQDEIKNVRVLFLTNEDGTVTRRYYVNDNVYIFTDKNIPPVITETFTEWMKTNVPEVDINGLIEDKIAYLKQQAKKVFEYVTFKEPVPYKVLVSSEMEDVLTKTLSLVPTMTEQTLKVGVLSDDGKAEGMIINLTGSQLSVLRDTVVRVRYQTWAKAEVLRSKFGKMTADEILATTIVDFINTDIKS